MHCVPSLQVTSKGCAAVIKNGFPIGFSILFVTQKPSLECSKWKTIFIPNNCLSLSKCGGDHQQRGMSINRTNWRLILSEHSIKQHSRVNWFISFIRHAILEKTKCSHTIPSHLTQRSSRRKKPIHMFDVHDDEQSDLSIKRSLALSLNTAFHCHHARGVQRIKCSHIN